MYARIPKSFVNNLFNLQFNAAANRGRKIIRQLSTKHLTATQYDDLYNERFATFQCKLPLYFFIYFCFFQSIYFFPHFFLSFACSLFLSRACFFCERISYKIITKRFSTTVIFNCAEDKDTEK